MPNDHSSRPDLTLTAAILALKSVSLSDGRPEMHFTPSSPEEHEALYTLLINLESFIEAGISGTSPEKASETKKFILNTDLNAEKLFEVNPNLRTRMDRHYFSEAGFTRRSVNRVKNIANNLEEAAVRSHLYTTASHDPRSIRIGSELSRK